MGFQKSPQMVISWVRSTYRNFRFPVNSKKGQFFQKNVNLGFCEPVPLSDSGSKKDGPVFPDEIRRQKITECPIEHGFHNA